MASKAKSTDVPAVPLDEILLPLRDALWQACGRRDLAMNPVNQTAASRTLYALTGPGTVTAQTDRICKLNQLFPKTNPELWLGILLELRKRTREAPSAQDNYEVFHVSIQAFEGATSQTIEPLLRAEWDPVIARAKQGPAQPHWHAYATSVEREHGFTDEGYQQFEGASQIAGASKQRQHKMHFALCANWHKKNGSEFEILGTPEELKSWVVGTLEYIKSQVGRGPLLDNR
jgi:hypothetical protein